MAVETILQHELLVKFVYPFLIIFFILFAILEKTQIFGEDKKQLNALLSFVIGLLFVAFTSPKLMVQNLILFLTIAIIIVFIALLLWGFIMGGESLKIFENSEKWFKIVVAVVLVIAVGIAVLWAAGLNSSAFDFLFGQSWSKEFWTNAVFIIVIAIALALVAKKKD